MINYLYNNNNYDKKLIHKLRISMIVKEASVYKNRFKTPHMHFRKNKIMCPVPEMSGPLWG